MRTHHMVLNHGIDAIGICCHRCHVCVESQGWEHLRTGWLHGVLDAALWGCACTVPCCGGTAEQVQGECIMHLIRDLVGQALHTFLNKHVSSGVAPSASAAFFNCLCF